MLKTQDMFEKKLDVRTLKRLHKGIQSLKSDICHLAKIDNPKEAESVKLICSILEHALGYNDWIPQKNIGRKTADILINSVGRGKVICECKKYHPIRNCLDTKAQEQLQKYCKDLNNEWGILTDGIRWQLYRYDKKDKEIKLAAEAHFFDFPKKVNQSYCEQFYIFHNKISSDESYQYAAKYEALSKENIYWLLHSKEAVKCLWRLIKQNNTNVKPKFRALLEHRIDELFPITGRKPYEKSKKKVQNTQQEKK